MCLFIWQYLHQNKWTTNWHTHTKDPKRSAAIFRLLYLIALGVCFTWFLFGWCPLIRRKQLQECINTFWSICSHSLVLFWVDAVVTNSTKQKCPKEKCDCVCRFYDDLIAAEDKLWTAEPLWDRVCRIQFITEWLKGASEKWHNKRSIWRKS